MTILQANFSEFSRKGWPPSDSDANSFAQIHAMMKGPRGLETILVASWHTGSLPSFFFWAHSKHIVYNYKIRRRCFPVFYIFHSHLKQQPLNSSIFTEHPFTTRAIFQNARFFIILKHKPPLMPFFSSNMSSSQDSFTINIPNYPSPPQDLGSYMRSMHQHTKRQMDAMSRSQERRSRNNGHHTTPSMPNGVGGSSSSPDEYPSHH